MPSRGPLLSDLKNLPGTGHVSPVAWATEISGPFK